MANFPYTTGYSPLCWRHGVDVESLKKPGVYSPETFRTIQLFEPQFNANNKVLGRDTMAHSEKYNFIAEEQYGSRKHKSAIMHAVNKVLSFDIIRQYRILAALCCNDAKCCYDRMVHAVTSLAMQSKGVQAPPLVCMFTTIQNLNHTIRTHTIFRYDSSFFSYANLKPTACKTSTRCYLNLKMNATKEMPNLWQQQMMYDKNEQQLFHHNNYYLLRQDTNENITLKISHITRKSTNLTKIQSTTNSHLTMTPTSYQIIYVGFYTKRTYNPMQWIAALLCAWVTIAFMTNSKAFASEVTTTNYTTYPPTLKMAKITMKMTKKALTKAKVLRAKGQTKLTDQFLKEQERAAKMKVREDKVKKTAKVTTEKKLAAAKEAQEAKRNVEVVKEMHDGTCKEISSTPTGKKSRANGKTSKKEATMVIKECTPESPPKCARKTTPPPSEDMEEEFEVLEVKSGTVDLEEEVEFLGNKEGEEAKAMEAEEDTASTDNEDGLSDKQKAKRKAWRSANSQGMEERKSTRG